MRSCDTCPGGADCAADNLHPVLMQVHELYRGGMTDKFDILFALGEESVALLEKHDAQVTPPCWTKAALLAIADIIANKPEEDVKELVSSAVAAFSRFPWQIKELVEQAPDLYQAILEKDLNGDFDKKTTKRSLVKTCKAVAFQ